MKYVMALDEGTTSTRCILFDRSGNICASAQEPFNQIFPKPGWVEHDAMEIWDKTLNSARCAMEKLGVTAADIAAIGITNQRETTVVWDRNTGEPVANAIVWQCRRTSEMIDGIVAGGWSDKIRAKTGLVPDAYFSASKISWLLDNVPGAREKAEKGDLIFGTIDTWLIWKLTDGRVHVTDYTNASRTMLFNIKDLCWDKELCELFRVPMSMLPEAKPSSAVYGMSDAAMFGGEIPISGAAGDQQCALFGQCCFEPGEMKNTYGTGCFLLMNTGTEPVFSNNGLVTTIAASADGKPRYALEGSVFVAGAAIQWIRDQIGLVERAFETEAISFSVPDCAGAYVVPAFTGLGAPYWSQGARGCVVGITRGFGRAHFIRAVTESLAYQTDDICKAMEQDSGIRISSLRVDGGASANNFLMGFQAGISDFRVIRPACIETTALGAAYLAGLAVGYWSGLDDVRSNWMVGRTFEPDMAEEDRSRLLKGWHKAVKCALLWAED